MKRVNSLMLSALVGGLALMQPLVVNAETKQTVQTAELVKELVERAVAAETQGEQQEAFDDLMDLGCNAAPHIVTAMPDDRPLSIRYIRIENRSPDAFEAFGQYGPEVVTDALAAVLTYLTKGSCGFIHNGGSVDERQQAVACWQSFIVETPTDERCEVNTSATNNRIQTDGNRLSPMIQGR